MAPPKMRISFLGGASAIGASSALVQVADQSVLIDCGVRFRSDRALPDLEQLAGTKLDAILVTHAHSDHTGALPVVHEAYPAAPIHMTPPTRGLVEILQRDALKLMKIAGERESDVPLYTERQVEGMLGRVHLVHHDAPFVIGDIRVTYLPASHIVGAAMIHLETPAGNVLFSGDYSVAPQRTVPGLVSTTLPVDLVITESTYGNRAHADRKLAEERLVRTIAEVTEKKGRVLIPAFAIGRAQEVLLVLREAMRHGRMPSVPIFVDGMVRSVCGVYPQHERYLAAGVQRWIKSTGHPFFGADVRAVADASERKQIVAGGACIVISSSGMLTGGPSAFYASEFAPNERDAILITGYQDEESPGRALLDLAKNVGPRRLHVAGREVDVKCRFESYSLSAHADRMQMVGLIEALNPQAVALVHGDREAKEMLAQSLGPRDTILADDGVALERVFLRRRGGRPAPARPAPAPEPTADDEDSEPSLDEQLKRENPKGKLLEWCTRSRVVPPPTRFSPDGAGWVAELSVQVDGRTLDSGPVAGRNQKIAEQLAARALLEKLAAPQLDQAIRTLTPADSTRLRASNPKGKLLELCTKYRLPQPIPEQQPHTAGHLRRAALQFSRGRLCWSAWYLAPVAREAEQGACEELLNQLWAWKNGNLDPSKVTDGEPVPAEVQASKNPKSRLNELQQMRQIDGFGFDLVERKGAAHAPLFVVRGWAVRQGQRLDSPPFEASTKKDAELLAAADLASLLEPPPSE